MPRSASAACGMSAAPRCPQASTTRRAPSRSTARRSTPGSPSRRPAPSSCPGRIPPSSRSTTGSCCSRGPTARRQSTSPPRARSSSAIIYARFGEMSLSGSNSKFFCGIYGNTVSASGLQPHDAGLELWSPDLDDLGPAARARSRAFTRGRPGEDAAGRRHRLRPRGLEHGLAPDRARVSSASRTSTPRRRPSPGLPTHSNTSPSRRTRGFRSRALANGTVTLEAHANPAPGVTYPAPDGIVGTRSSEPAASRPGATRPWSS